MTNLTNLRYLKIKIEPVNRIKLSGISEIMKRMTKLKKLTELNIRIGDHNEITNEGVRIILNSLKELPNLEKLKVKIGPKKNFDENIVMDLNFILDILN